MQRQLQLTQYLQYELYHILGAYGIASSNMRSLAVGLMDPSTQSHPRPTSEEPDKEAGPESEDKRLADVARWAGEHNADLAIYRHGKPYERRRRQRRRDSQRAPLARDPIPRSLPLSSAGRFKVALTSTEFNEARGHHWDPDWLIIPSFYRQALYALERYDPQGPIARDDSGLTAFAKSLVARRDTLAPAAEPNDHGHLEALKVRISHRKHRYRERLDDALRHLPPPGSTSSGEAIGADPGSDQNLELPLHEIVGANLSKDDDRLPVFLVRALAEAHMSMHAVEAWKAMCLAEEAMELDGDRRAWLYQELSRCIALNTFVYCASRTAPWMFAADPGESREIFDNSEHAWETVVPARGIWIANQIGLLALHRRAYARALQGDVDSAYNDYHKLHRLIRDGERRIRAAPTHVQGALEFFGALDAQAHHHIGELYRREHAHRQARTHFAAASHRLDSLRDNELMKAVLTNSRWYVELQVSHGKTSYEMGRHKEALCWYLRGWAAFLNLLAADTGTEANTTAIEEAVKWLERVRYEPEISKSSLRSYLAPVIQQLERVTVSRRYGALAGQILLRLGHLLFILNLGHDLPAGSAAPTKTGEIDIKHALAATCLAAAAKHDKYNTLIAADRLKTLLRLEIKSGQAIADDLARSYHDDHFSVIDSWPGGTNDYERIARTAEYLLLRAQLSWRPPTEGDSIQQQDAHIARELLVSFFMSTDSINVRKSQVHGLLMREQSTNDLRPQHDEKAGIEFVCMRRYSSAFPLLPRPSAFRALGGGYFLRLHPATRAEDSEPPPAPFGIVIDPGFHFTENLYRTGHSLSDINMVIVTHDHVDHAGSLDALISLWHVRSRLRRKQDENSHAHQLAILVSDSVACRYRHTGLYNDLLADDSSESESPGPSSREFTFLCLEELAREPEKAHDRLAERIRFPSEFRILPLSTASVDAGKLGHRDLSGKPSFGICVKVAMGHGSVAIAGDAPKPPAEGTPAHESWLSDWGAALNADLLIAHLSSVPLTELRQLADPRSPGSGIRLDESDAATVEELNGFVAELDDIRAKLEGADRSHRLGGQIEYGLWLRSKSSGGSPLVADIAGPVDADWSPPPEHAFLRGTMSWARAYGQTREDRGGLFVVGELTEELGSMRGRVADAIKRYVYDAPTPISQECATARQASKPSMSSLSGDIGLRVFISENEHGSRAEVRVLCTTCNLDTDRVRSERYHSPSEIVETCVKGENEGIFYNCFEHAPGLQSDPVFLEQLERFDVFGR